MHIKMKPPEFIIEKGIPIPKKVTRFDFLKHMKVGESFLIPENSDVSDMRIYSEAKIRNVWVRIMEIPEGLRVWRVYLRKGDVMDDLPGNKTPQTNTDETDERPAARSSEAIKAARRGELVTAGKPKDLVKTLNAALPSQEAAE
jgi:hypothetical protein